MKHQFLAIDEGHQKLSLIDTANPITAGRAAWPISPVRATCSASPKTAP